MTDRRSSSFASRTVDAVSGAWTKMDVVPPIGTSAGGRMGLTPDGKQVLYLSLEKGIQAAWISATDGSGKPRQLTNVYTVHPVVSPDGKLVAYVSLDNNQPVISICA